LPVNFALDGIKDRDMADYQTHSWPSVVAFYQAAARDGPRFAAMADLVQQIARSPYAAGLHPVTSHYMLRLFAHERFDPSDDQIQIEHDGEAFEVRYAAAMGRSSTTAPITSDWHRRSSDGFAGLARCLHHLRWFIEERPVGSRPAV
jgi:hypothetical protein